MISSLAQEFKRRPSIPLDDYMAICLSHRDGYYRTQTPIGAAGDFITAPDISQIFGELIGACLNDWWIRNNRPALHLIELGPGRGTMMADILRVSQAEFVKHTHIHLVDVNPFCIAEQQKQLKPYSCQWHDSVDAACAAAQGATFILANEFLDVFPTKQFQYSNNSWYEIFVSCEDEKLSFVNKKIDHNITADLNVESVFYEHSAGVKETFEKLSNHIYHFGGAGLFIDYGYDQMPIKSTLQAVKSHQHVDFLSNPGLCDLTSHIDFTMLVNIAKNAKISSQPLATQNQFLNALGFDIRLHQLMGSALSPQQGQNILTAAHRLINPQSMGSIFKVLAVHHSDFQALAGFKS